MIILNLISRLLYIISVEGLYFYYIVSIFRYTILILIVFINSVRCSTNRTRTITSAASDVLSIITGCFLAVRKF